MMTPLGHWQLCSRDASVIQQAFPSVLFDLFEKSNNNVKMPVANSMGRNRIYR